MANGDIGAPGFGIGAQKQKEASARDRSQSRKWVTELLRLSREQRTARRLEECARTVLSTPDGTIYAASRRLGQPESGTQVARAATEPRLCCRG